MNDESIMPFGKHKGKPMIEVPDEYLLWFWRQNKEFFKKHTDFALGDYQANVMRYVEDCFDAQDLL